MRRRQRPGGTAILARERYVIRNLKKIVRQSIRLSGYDLRKIPPAWAPPAADAGTLRDTRGLTRIQYACGPKFLRDWVNIDCYPPGIMQERFGLTPADVYYQVDLSARQPFADQTFTLAFAEDFIEHLGQQDSLLFLGECRRVLMPGGVLRLSFPGLEGVLRRHFSTPEFDVLRKGVEDAYLHYEHLHFYSREELSLVARHLGFSEVRFTGFGISDHEGLRGLETRNQQQDLNIYAELTR